MPGRMSLHAVELRRKAIEKGVKDGLTMTGMAKRLGMSPSGLAAWCKRHNVRFRRHGPVLAQEEVDRRTAIIRKAVAESLTIRETAARAGLNPSTLYHFCRDYGIALPRFQWDGSPGVIVSPHLRKRLAAPAILRGMSPPELAARILNTVIEDDLFAAVLDDTDDGDVP